MGGFDAGETTGPVLCGEPELIERRADEGAVWSPFGRTNVGKGHDLIDDAGEFAAGSMGPKVAAALRFVDTTSPGVPNRTGVPNPTGVPRGPRAVITSLSHITEAVAGEFGTVVAA